MLFFGVRGSFGCEAENQPCEEGSSEEFIFLFLFLFLFIILLLLPSCSAVSSGFPRFYEPLWSTFEPSKNLQASANPVVNLVGLGQTEAMCRYQGERSFHSEWRPIGVCRGLIHC